MESARTWTTFFCNWPKDLPRRGIVVNTLNETVPFKEFMISDNVLLLDRTNPDPAGSRFVMLEFESISLLKLIDAVPESVFAAMGFLGKPSA